MAKKKNKSARERLIDAAEQLFNAEGIRSAGIDRIIAEAGVAKMTLYNHFPSKDDLILAVLQHREQQINEMFETSIDKYVRKGVTKLEAFFDALRDWFKSSGFRGCSFINAAIELADARHPASKFASQHKKRLQSMIRGLVVESAGDEAADMVPAIHILAEGAIVTAVLQGSHKPAETAKKAAIALIS